MPSILYNSLFVLSVCGVTILNIFVNGALIIALPTLGKALDFSESELQWPLNVYALSYGSLLLLFGRLADVVGSKRMFLFGTGFFTIWSIATGVAPNKVALIVFVALTGVGAAANTPTGIGIFSNHFEPGPSRNRAIAALGAGQAIGYIVGLIGGGFLCQSGQLWRVIFYIQGGLAAVFFALGVYTIPPDGERAKYDKGIDWVGAVLSVAGVGLLTFVLSESTVVKQGWKTPWIIALLIVSLVILGAFVAWETYRERRERSVIMPISLWTKPGTKMGPMVTLVFLAWASYNALSYFITLFYQQIRGDDPVHTSLETLPFAIMAFIVNVVAGWLLGTVRGDVLIGVGLLGTLAAPLIFVFVDPHASYWKGAFLIMLTISWTDVAYTVGNLQISISFDSRSQGLAGGIFNVATRLGTSLALALSSSVASAVSQSYHAKHPELAVDSKGVLMAGFRAGGWVSVALAAAALLVCVFGIRGIGVIGVKANPDMVLVEGEGKADKVGDVESGVVIDGQTAEGMLRNSEKLRTSVGGAQVVTLPSIRISTDVNAPRRTSVLISPGGRHSVQMIPPSMEGSATRSTS
ncbi:MFS general substrate transporter [Ganoderma sinense ZZ0214-1]|uniref:MFS general substrate transporter n=1 Tax=Ganoderma sinense ZZ0214-1 TaxID=1077348 RepID=A0A2G8RY74_9APHY|nr:MFS general substrate transporter [Ganoderma sinense ZZ0214-1]